MDHLSQSWRIILSIPNSVFLNKLALNVLRLLQDEYSKANEKISIKRLLKKMSYHPERVLEGLIKIYAA